VGIRMQCMFSRESREKERQKYKLDDGCAVIFQTIISSLICVSLFRRYLSC
jgi:hypothetical protein